MLSARSSHIDLGLLTIVVAHATFCIVTVFNNVQARLRRMGGNLEEASMDLGARGFTTFRLVTFPMLRSALLAGGLLAFGLSFDEIIVTTFTAGPERADAAVVDLQQPLPAQPGAQSSMSSRRSSCSSRSCRSTSLSDSRGPRAKG